MSLSDSESASAGDMGVLDVRMVTKLGLVRLMQVSHPYAFHLRSQGTEDVDGGREISCMENDQHR